MVEFCDRCRGFEGSGVAGTLGGLTWIFDDFFICHSASLFVAEEMIVCKVSLALFAHTLCMCLLAMLATTVVAPCLSGHICAPGSSGSGVDAGVS